MGVADGCGAAAVTVGGEVPCAGLASFRVVAEGEVGSGAFDLAAEERLSPAGRPKSGLLASGVVVRFAEVGGGSLGVRRTRSDD